MDIRVKRGDITRHHAGALIVNLFEGVTQPDHLFLLRAQLLAVMMSAFARGQSRGRFRNKAMALNIDHISAYLSNRFQNGIVKFLKVA